MAIKFADGYTLPSADQPLNHARILYEAISGTVIASTAADGFPASAAANALTYESWKPTAVPATWTVTAGEPVTVDCLGVAAHDLGVSDMAVTVQYQVTDGGAWADVASATVRSNRPLMLMFEPVTGYAFRAVFEYNDDPLVYVVFDDSDDSFVRPPDTQIPVLGVIRFGKTMQMTQPVFGGATPAWLNRQATYDTNMSQSGEWLGRSVRRSGQPLGIEWQHIKASWVRGVWKPFMDGVRDNPFFIAWNPLRDPEGTAYAYATEMVPPTNMGVRDYMTIGLRGEAHDNE